MQIEKTIKKEIVSKYGTVYKYCKAFNLQQGDLSKFLKGETSHSLKLIQRHCANLNLKMEVLVKDNGTK